MDWAISSQASNRGRFNDYPVAGSREFPEMPSTCLTGEDIVYSPDKYRETEGI